MSLKLIYKTILFEAKIDVVKNKYPEYTMILDFFKDVKPKYIEWVGKLFSSKKEMHNTVMSKIFMDPENANLVETIKDEVINKWIQTLFDFDRFCEMNLVKNKDIQKYKDFSEVQEQVRQAKITYETRLKEKEKEKALAPVKIFEDDSILVIQPKTVNSSCKYGSGTKWCISAKESDNYFDSYTRNGYKFIFIINKKTNDKDAIAYNEAHVSTIPRLYEIYNSADDRIEYSELEQKYSKNILDAIENYIGTNKNFIIIYSGHGGIMYTSSDSNYKNTLKIKTNPSASEEDYGYLFMVSKTHPKASVVEFVFRRMSILDVISERTNDYEDGDEYSTITKTSFSSKLEDETSPIFLDKIEEYFGRKIFYNSNDDFINGLTNSNPSNSDNNIVFRIYNLIRTSKKNSKLFLANFKSIADTLENNLKNDISSNDIFGEKNLSDLYNFCYNMSRIFNEISFGKPVKLENEEDIKQIYEILARIEILLNSENGKSQENDYIIEKIIPHIEVTHQNIDYYFSLTNKKQLPENIKRTKLSLSEIFLAR